VLRLHLVVSSTARPFPAAGAAVCLDMGTVQGDLARWLGGCCHRLEYLLPDAAIAPSGEAIVDGLRGAVFPWAIDPTAADLQDMHDPAQDAPVILALRPGLVRRQVRHDLRPLIVGEPKQMRIHRLASNRPASFLNQNIVNQVLTLDLPIPRGANSILSRKEA